MHMDAASHHLLLVMDPTVVCGHKLFCGPALQDSSEAAIIAHSNPVQWPAYFDW